MTAESPGALELQPLCVEGEVVGMSYGCGGVSSTLNVKPYPPMSTLQLPDIHVTKCSQAFRAFCGSFAPMYYT